MDHNICCIKCKKKLLLRDGPYGKFLICPNRKQGDNTHLSISLKKLREGLKEIKEDLQNPTEVMSKLSFKEELSRASAEMGYVITGAVGDLIDPLNQLDFIDGWDTNYEEMARAKGKMNQKDRDDLDRCFEAF